MRDLRYKIIKVYHDKKEHAFEAGKHLRDVDIASIEINFCPESLARNVEQFFWMKYKKIQNPAVDKLETAVKSIMGPSVKDFYVALCDILIEQRKPVIILERVKDEEHKILQENSVPDLDIGNEILEGNLEVACEKIFQNYKERNLLRGDKRDRIMGENSKTIHKRILELYPEFNQRKDKPNYGIILGCGHNPEKYISEAGYSTRVVDTTKGIIIPNMNASEKIGFLVREGAPQEKINELLAVQALAVAGRFIYGFDDAQFDQAERCLVERAKHEDILSLFEKIKQTKSTDGQSFSEEQVKLLDDYFRTFS